MIVPNIDIIVGEEGGGRRITRISISGYNISVFSFLLRQ